MEIFFTDNVGGEHYVPEDNQEQEYHLAPEQNYTEEYLRANYLYLLVSRKEYIQDS